MKRIKYSVNFALTFKPELKYISSLLKIANFDDLLSIKEVSNLTGIPSGNKSGKVVPHLYYAYYMGLINLEVEKNTFKFSLTNLGQMVLKEDVGFQEDLTLLLCHVMLCRPNDGALMWSKAFLEIFPKYRKIISKSLLINELNVSFDNKVGVKNIAPFINCYVDSLANLKLLEIDSNEDIKIIPHKYSNDFLYLYAFALLKIWDDLYPNIDEISANDLEKFKFGNYFNWNYLDTYQVLENLADANIIRFNRQLSPFTILRLTTSSEVEAKIYSLLF